MKILTALILVLFVVNAIANDHGYGRRSRYNECHWRNRHFIFHFYRPLQFDYTTQMTDYTQQCLDNWNSDASKLRGFHNRITLNYKAMNQNPARSLLEFKRMVDESYTPSFKKWCVSGGWVSLPAGEQDAMESDFNKISAIARCGQLVANYQIKINRYNELVDAETQDEDAISSLSSRLKDQIQTIVDSKDCLNDPNMDLEAFVVSLAEME